MNACSQNLIQIYGCFSDSVTLEQKETVWMIFAIQIVNLLNLKSSRNRKDIIKLMENFIISFDGKKFLKSDIPSVQETTILVQLKSSTPPSPSPLLFLFLFSFLIFFYFFFFSASIVRKTISFPLNSTFHYLRSRLSDIFSLSSDFDLYLGPEEIKLPRSSEEDYSLVILDHFPDSERIVTVVVLKQKNKAIIEKERFLENLSANKEFFDCFFLILEGRERRKEIGGRRKEEESKKKNEGGGREERREERREEERREDERKREEEGGEEGEEELAWRVLSLIPLNVDVREKLIKSASEKKVDWEIILESRCYRKLFYYLEAIESIISAELK